jgi:hypothetical protein
VSTVPSSTSSFERAVPGGRWGATWLVVAIAAVVILVRYELFLRGRGYQPSLKDDEYAWSLERARVSDDSPHTMALLGSSRIMLGFSGEAFRAALPNWKYVQLGVNGSHPIPTLQDLAADPHFRGVALVEITEVSIYRESWPAQAHYVETYHRGYRAIGQLVERWLATRVQSRLALLSTRGVATFGKWLRTQEWPGAPYLTTHADRTRFADYAKTDVERQRSLRLAALQAPPMITVPPEEWIKTALSIEPAITAIEARGGHVVYLRMPTCGERWDADEKLHPKAAYWDLLAKQSRATMIHFRDYPELASFECPDLSHIASADGPRFTRALIEILRAKGLLRD